MIYQMRVGSRFKIDPQAVGEKLEKIREEHGKVSPETVVEEARDKKSPLHPAFEWDNKKASHQYRLEQARALSRAIVYIPNEAPDSPPVRAFVNVLMEGDDDRSYTSMHVVMSDEMLRNQMLEQALKEAKWFSEKYRELNELSDVFSAIKKTVKKLSHGKQVAASGRMAG